VKPKKTRQGYQQFMSECYPTLIAPIVEARWNAQCIDVDGNVTSRKGPEAPFRAKVSRDLFAELPVEEQIVTRARATEIAEAAKKEFEDALKNGPSKSPEAQQQYVFLVSLGNILAFR
jgi:hypothetical protein